MSYPASFTVQEIGYITDITINTHICTDVLSEYLLVNKNHGVKLL